MVQHLVLLSQQSLRLVKCNCQSADDIITLCQARDSHPQLYGKLGLLILQNTTLEAHKQMLAFETVQMFHLPHGYDDHMWPSFSALTILVAPILESVAN